MALPRMIRVRQTFARPRVADIPRAVAATLGEAALRIKPGDTVAVGAGSRGIANIGTIVGATVKWLRDLGARPFVFPAMGSHGGGTADGQLSVLEHYGITEATMGCSVRATMDVVKVGEALGLPVWLDAYAAEATWIGVVNRVKPHTDFHGPVESGLLKMIAIGLGNQKGADTFHAQGFAEFHRLPFDRQIHKEDLVHEGREEHSEGKDEAGGVRPQAQIALPRLIQQGDEAAD